MNDQDVRIEAGPRQYGHGEVRFHLKITDGISTQPVANVELSADQWLGLTAGTSISVPGWLIPDTLHYRLGKRMENEAVAVPEDVAPLWGPNTQAQTDAVINWAEDRVRDSDWTDYDEPRRNNKGQTIVVFRRWVTP